jgi:WD40 repeat protein
LREIAWVLVFSPDGTWISAFPGGLTIWEVDTGRQVHGLGVPNQDGYALGAPYGLAQEAAVSADGFHAVGIGLKHVTLPAGEKFFPEGNFPLPDRILTTFDATVDRIHKDVTTRLGEPSGPVALSPDGKRIIVGISRDRHSRRMVLDFATGAEIGALENRPGLVYHAGPLTVRPDGTLIAGAGSKDRLEDGYILPVWDFQTGRLLQTTPGPVAPIRAVAFLPDRIRVLSGGWGSTPLNRDEGVTR